MERGAAHPRHIYIKAFIDKHFEPLGKIKNKKGEVLNVKQCKVCKGTMPGKHLKKRTSGKITYHHRGNLKRHLEQAHGIVYGGAGGAGAGSSKEPDLMLPKGQQSIKAFTNVNPQEEAELLDACVLFCALDNRPFAAVEGRGLKHLLTVATRGRWKLPGRRTIARRCTAMAAQARAATRALIQKDTADGANFTYSFDAWTDRCDHLRAGFGYGVLFNSMSDQTAHPPAHTPPDTIQITARCATTWP